ncbi:MAG: hypothetical protein ASARMPREDX12_009310 [Alectoria sarmentosa]|nr:MAG: hypothetical protein ASARMPREDX12_009310 [Alectoria sarmentosa]
MSLSKRGSPAVQACKILVDQLGGPKNATKYTFVDACAGAGGPTPLIEQRMNEQLKSAGLDSVRFVLTDLWPDIKAWKDITSRSENISYIEQPIDATKGVRLSGPDGKECRMFNLSFHHFDDAVAEKVLASAVESADAFVIFELTHRTLPALLNTTLIILSPFITTLMDWYWSPMYLLFTYIIPLIPIFYAIDGYVSCARCRTADETWDLLTRHTGLSVREWELKNGWELSSGQQVVLPPFGTLYWYTGVIRQRV